MSATTVALDALFRQFLADCQRLNGRLPQLIRDEAWPSLCIVDDACCSDGLCQWRPVLRETPGSFSNVEQAIELCLDETVKEFYQSYFCDTLTVTFAGHDFSLLQVWNEQDFAGLQENLIGHLLMKKRLRQTPTVFIGCIDDDTIVSVDNESGKVVVERVGCEPHKTLADSLPQFLQQLTVSVSAD